MSTSSLSLFVNVAKGLEPLLTNELHSLGLENIKPTRAGVACQGTLMQAYRICLWSRLANRVLLPLTTFPAPDTQALYEGVRTIDWSEHLTIKNTLAIEFNSSQSNITHTHFGALKVKDAIVDQFRERYGERPNIAIQQPDIRINVYLHNDVATVSLDLSGESLHKRSYRENSVQAPMKENLAAAILLYSNWPRIAQDGGHLLDPLCGSGTLLIEAALMAADCAPGLLREYFGFLNWQQHIVKLWKTLLDEALERKTVGLSKTLKIIGYDADNYAVRAALTNIEKAGLHGKIHVEKRQLARCEPLHAGTGLIVTNPPYGLRLGEVEELKHLYGYLGDVLKNHFQGWEAAIFTGNPELGKQVGIRAHKKHTLYNGTIECNLLHFHVIPERFMHADFLPTAQHSEHRQVQDTNLPLEPAKNNPILPVTLHLNEQTQGFANRLRKNVKNLEQWAKKENIHCYRVYDADLPDYALAIDKYEQWVHVQEYAPPKTIDPNKAQLRLQDALEVIAEVLMVPKKQIFLKVRSPQRGNKQYEKQNTVGQFHEVREGKALFLVNFADYLDTGLFLDHRLTRQMIFDLAKGQRFLNLFGYTGTATVQAALGGATATTTVDLSKNYLAWARRTLARNGFSDKHHVFIQANCLEWLDQESEHLKNPRNRGQRYGVIFLDPPTFSNSKRMEGVLDVQHNHVQLIKAALNCLTHEGILLFSTNYQKFKMDTAALAAVQLDDISHLTLPKDFARNPRIHQCWKITLS